MEHLGAHGEPGGDIPLEEPSGVPIILIARAGVYPVACAPISRPRARALLEPERKEELRIACSQAPGLAAGRRRRR